MVTERQANKDPAGDSRARYWDALSAAYRDETRISTTDFHYGPLLPGDSDLGLLPGQVDGLRCLEVGCGGAQNSICLARRGADCTAVDISPHQLAWGRQLAAEAGVEVELRLADLDDLPVRELGRFDLVHSTFALPFSREPGRAVRTWSNLLRPGGMLLLTTAHPVYAGEWTELEDGTDGVLVPDYFRPPADLRPAGPDHTGIRSRSWPVAAVIRWVREAGLWLDRLLEPEPLPIPAMADAEIRARVPYESDAWRELYPVLARVPTVMVLRCLNAEVRPPDPIRAQD
jgi:SAM-dependent methyltransferase